MKENNVMIQDLFEQFISEVIKSGVEVESI